MKQIAVLGSDGQLGKTLKSLADKERNKYVFYSKKDIDITDKKTLKDVFKLQNFDFCINCAAYTNVEVAEKNKDEAFLINAEGVKHIAEACNANKVKLIHISSDYIFDGKKRSPYTTSDKPNPINQYGKSKLKGELYIKEMLNAHYIIRSSWLYSAHGKNFLKTIISKVEENKGISITTEERGTPTSCVDLSEFIKFIINTNEIPYGVYNFSARGSTTWYGFAKEIAEHFQEDRKEIIAPTKSFKTLAKRPKYSILDITETEKNYKNLDNWQKSVSIVIEKIKKTNSH